MSEIFSEITRNQNHKKSFRGLRVGGHCRGTCSRYSITTKWGQKKYEFGLRFCSYCKIWFDHNDRLCCICCGKRLRYHRRGKKK